jgi:hypothetical protein
VSNPAWGRWTLNPDIAALEINGGALYYVDLDQLRDPGQVVDWLCQIAGKTWADDETLAGFVRAVVDIFSPQGTMCPGGNMYRINDAQLTGLIEAACKRHGSTEGITP